jgi:hypothetical protein
MGQAAARIGMGYTSEQVLATDGLCDRPEPNQQQTTFLLGMVYRKTTFLLGIRYTAAQIGKGYTTDSSPDRDGLYHIQQPR